MAMACTTIQFLSFLLLLSGTTLIGTSIGTTDWSYSYTEQDILGQEMKLIYYRGLWRQCVEAEESSSSSSPIQHSAQLNFGCETRFSVETNFDTTAPPIIIHQSFKAWEISVLALMSASALVGIFSVICCGCCRNRCGYCLATFVLLGGLCSAGGVGVYAYFIKNSDEQSQTLTLETLINAFLQTQFGWSYWLAAGGGACQLLSAIFYYVSACNCWKRQYTSVPTKTSYRA